MLRAFEDSNIRVLIRYFEMPVYKGGHDLETLPDNPELAKQKHIISGVEIIDVHTKSIITLSECMANAIAENINEVLKEIPPPVHISEAEPIF